MNEFSFSFPHQAETMAATVHPAPGSDRGVVLLPGWGGTRYGPQRILVAAARALAEAGRTSLRVDFRGRGDSTGDPARVTLDGMIEDAVAASQWLEREQGVRKVAWLGLCAGANVALGAASLRPDVTEEVVAWSILPFMEHKEQAHGRHDKSKTELWKFYMKKAMDPEAWKKLVQGQANVRGAVRTLRKDKEGDEEERRRKTSRRDILKDLDAYRGRCLFIFGAAFFQARLQRQGISHEIQWIPGAPHNFYTVEWTRRVIRLTVDWLKSPESTLNSSRTGL
ncbi:MAG: hypothetical protein HYU43_07845 [Armatimonadetes bacterium]|nr:hypothetical protein [Armatimonadota bacterium]